MAQAEGLSDAAGVSGHDPVYVGRTTAHGHTVWVDQDGSRHPLETAAGHPDGGFEWGHPGPAALELSRSILRDATQAEPLAERLGRDFTWEVVARLPADGFRLTRAEVLAWLEQRPEST